ncbi:unnamed protein product [Clonostachys rhizophaga]|uniref:Uncharacterized protein n=1 Tax=Clonostachys rhizophaga TaxID=160324 RepID=A0A9N9V7G9_9HYPO|nr:unnamed protein product [Clonostachys rhizophaga]
MEEVYNTLTLTGAKWWDLQHSPNEETFKATQFWLDQTSKAVEVEIQTVEPAQRDAWLKRRTDDKGRTLIARYVWLSATGPNKNEINLTKVVQNTLCEQFGLKTAYKYFHTFVSGVASLPRESTPEFERQAFAFCFGPKLAAIWSHRLSKTSTDDITEGIIFTQGDAVQQTYLRFISKIPWNHGICLSSAFLAYLFSMVLCSEIDTLQKTILQGVKEIEGETGFHGFAERKKKLEQGRSLATEAMVEMSAKASGFTTKLAGTGRKSDMIEQLLELMLKRASEDRANRERLASGRKAKDKEPNGAPILRAHVEVMRQRMKMQSSETKYIQERVQIQISATFHTISQNDTLANLEVAEETSQIAYYSYRDASSMKTLAFVTMVFLPGSFISALFSTQVFNWEAGGGFSVGVNPRFGLYWVITIPLTLIVFLLYYVWIGKLKRDVDKRKKDREERRKTLTEHPDASSSSYSIRGPGNNGRGRTATFADHIKLKRMRTRTTSGHAENGTNAV